MRFLFFFFFSFFWKNQISFFFFFLNKMWSFEQPFWKIIVFKNQTNLFTYEGSRSLNSCNQNLLLSFAHCQIKSPKAIKKWNVIIFRNHIVRWKQGECSKFEISFESFEDLRIWEFEKFCSRTNHLMGFDNFKHFSFLIQEKILLEFKMRLQLARLQGGLIHRL